MIVVNRDNGMVLKGAYHDRLSVVLMRLVP